MHTYGALFAEIRVDADLGLVRLNRCTGVYGAGRIINPLAARSQMIDDLDEHASPIGIRHIL